MSNEIKYWWLGFKTRPNSASERGIFQDTYLQAFLDGHADHYGWPTVGSSDSYARYDAMSRGDHVVLYCGGGSGQPDDYGVLAFATIMDRTEPGELPGEGIIKLGRLERFAPILPFNSENDGTERTEDSDFLWDLMGSEFLPLHDVYNRLGYTESERQAVTVWDLEPKQYWAMHRRAERVLLEGMERRAA